MDVGGDDQGAGGAVQLWPDDLPDGIVVADDSARVVLFNSAAERITGVHAASALGKHLEDALPLESLDGRSWWTCATPYAGMRTVTGHPERNLLLGGTEVLVALPLRARRAGRGHVVRVVVEFCGTRQ